MERRPYFNFRIDDLQQLHRLAGQDIRQLRELQRELSYRRVPKAQQLRRTVDAEVAVLLGGASSTPSPPSPRLSTGRPLVGQARRREVHGTAAGQAETPTQQPQVLVLTHIVPGAGLVQRHQGTASSLGIGFLSSLAFFGALLVVVLK